MDELIPESTVSGEDCLDLNIWCPELGAAKCPVMVWIPGGMFEYHGTGACPWYDDNRFARDGADLVERESADMGSSAWDGIARAVEYRPARLGDNIRHLTRRRHSES